MSYKESRGQKRDRVHNNKINAMELLDKAQIKYTEQSELLRTKGKSGFYRCSDGYYKIGFNKDYIDGFGIKDFVTNFLKEAGE